MKLFSFLIFFGALSFGQQPAANIEAQSSGTCSPNILSNQGRVQFTCNAAMDKATATKIVSLLNQILHKQANGGSESDVNQKLDEILTFLRSEAQAREPRHFTEDQKQALINALSPTPNQVVNILTTARSAEIDTLESEFIDIFGKAGWRIGNRSLALSGLERVLGLGVVVHSNQGHPIGADKLFLMLKDQGFKVETGTNSQVPTNEIRLVIAPKQ